MPMKLWNALMVSDSGGVNVFKKAQEPSWKRNVGVPKHPVLDCEFMVPANFCECRRVFHVGLEGRDIEPGFPCALA